MNNPLPGHPFCDVIGCRKAASVVTVSTRRASVEECLCEPCYLNLILSQPEMAASYRPIYAEPTIGLVVQGREVASAGKGR